jgi:hypothetical protein
MAREYDVPVVFEDLGSWGADELRSEYDPHVPAIRINERVLGRLSSDDAHAFVALAVGHELYHHLERLGEVPRLSGRRHRERAADAFARELLRSE